MTDDALARIRVEHGGNVRHRHVIAQTAVGGERHQVDHRAEHGKAIGRNAVDVPEQIADAGLPFLAALPNLREVALEALPGVTLAGTKVFPPAVRVRYST